MDSITIRFKATAIVNNYDNDDNSCFNDDILGTIEDCEEDNGNVIMINDVARLPFEAPALREICI